MGTDILKKAQIIQTLRDAEDFDIYFEHVVSEVAYDWMSDHAKEQLPRGAKAYWDRIVFDPLDGNNIYYVVVDRDELELEAENVGAWVNWEDDKSFLKDMFWSNLDWLNVIEP